jgi:hypothetical protein
MTAHGLDGNLYVKRFSPAQNTFSKPKLLFRAEDYPPGIIDGNLSVLDNKIHVFLRRYPSPEPIFYTQGTTINTLDPPTLLVKDNKLNLGAQWGRTISLPDNSYDRQYLQVFYGGCQEPPEPGLKVPERCTRPAVYESLNHGKTWTFLSWITPLCFEGQLCANETAIVYSPHRIFALMRTAGEWPGPLFLSYSDDEGVSWSTPKRTGLYGEALMFYTLPDGRILACFRGFPEGAPKDGGNFSVTEFNPKTLGFTEPFEVEAYHGNHYDGGYGDIIWLPEQQKLLVAYYYSSHLEPRNPWIRYATLSLS